MIKKSTSIIQKFNTGTKLIAAFVLTFICLSFGVVKAQVPYNEGFEVVGPYPQGSLPFGWSQGKYGGGSDPDNEWEVMNNTTTNPVASPHGGTSMMRYKSNLTTATEAAFLSTKKLDMSTNFAGAAGSFWMYRDGLSPGQADRIQVYANSNPDMTGTPTAITGVINRYCGSAPAATCGAWYQVFFTVPNTYASTSVYVSIVATSAAGQNIYVDDFTIDTYPVAQNPVTLTAAVVNQNTATTAPNQSNVQIIGLKVTVTGGGAPVTLQDIEFNTNGSDNPPSDIINAKLWFTGGTTVFDPATALLVGTVATPWATNYIFVPAPSTFSALENGDNYFWITYDIPLAANFGNYVDAECVGFTASGLAKTPAPATLPGRRLIDVVYCIATYTVGTSWLGGSYTNNDYVRNVVLAGDVAPGINNTWNTVGPPVCGSPCHFSAHPPDYEYFPPSIGHTAIVTQGNNYPIALQVGTWYSSNYIAAFIDYNRDGDLTDPGEKIAQSPSMSSLGTYNTNFTVPLTASPGNTRLRVREVYATSNIDPCSHRTYGEAEDYVITIVPTCAPAWPGWKTWLGFTNDWDNPANWCGGVPTLADDARIPGKGVGANDRPGDFAPTIKAGVIATARNLRVETNDTIYIDAASASSLTVNQTLTLLDNTSALKVNSSFSDSARVSNGTLTWPVPVGATNQPFKGNVEKVKNIWLYTQADLLAEGMLPGDIVTNMLFHVTRKASNNVPFKNLTVKIYYTDGVNPIPTGFRFNQPGKMPPIIGPAPVTVFGPADVSTASYIPVTNTDGTIDLTMIPGAFVWNGSANKLVVEMCYDNGGFAVPNNSDVPKYTQTLGYQHFISIYGSKDNLDYAACDMIPTSSISSAFFTGGTTGSTVITINNSFYYNQAAAGQFLNGNGVQSLNVAGGTYTAGSAVITYAAVPANIQVGMYAVRGGAFKGAKVLSKTATTVTMSTPATGSGASPISFYIGILSVSGANGNILTLTAPLLSNLSGNIGIGSQNSSPSTGTDYRPNITFKYDRPYQKYPINVKQDWLNNGLFVAGYSEVLLSVPSPAALQILGGNNVSTFWDLRIQNNNHVRMDQDAIVTDTLTLQNGRLKLNNHLMSLTNQNIGALRVINGRIQSDADVLGTDVAPFGRFHWDMGSVPGVRTIPFMNMAGSDLAFDYNIDAGSHDVTFATYATPANNQNIPAPIVTNILGQATPGVYNTSGLGMADRYYMVDNATPTGAQADMTFRYSSTEQPASNSNMRAQRWVNALGLWEQPLLPGQVFTAGLPNVVTLNDYNQFSQNVWWTIVGEATPLPVELLDFTATPFKDKVRLDWTTGTEINSSHFIVERSLNNTDFSFIDQLESKGPSSGNLNYRTWDMNPVEGIQYYYLRQYDHDGRYESFGPVSAKFSKELFDIITATVASSEQGVTVVFNYDSNEPYSYRIVDMTGRLIVAKDRNPAEPGVNVVDIDASFARGAYQIILQNSEKQVTRKFFY